MRSSPSPAVLYTSPLRRASETAEILGRVFQLRPILLPDLREISCGDLDGLPLREVQQRYPDIWQRNLKQDDDEFRWPGGESRLEFRARVVQAAARIAAFHPGERVLAVTHTGVVTQLIGAIAGLTAATWEAFRPGHASLTELLWADGVARLVRFNQKSHHAD
jgi:alpha-ribazole phosphatase/probable phosphoglycerate mutase